MAPTMRGKGAEKETGALRSIALTQWPLFCAIARASLPQHGSQFVMLHHIEDTMTETTCVGCAGRFAAIDGPTHRYMESTPGCWECFGQVLTREYSDLQYQRVHRLTVDAYALQHPGRASLQTIRSVALHSISLCAIFEDGIELNKATRVIQQAAKIRDRFEWLVPPASTGSLTIADVHQARDAEEHTQVVRQWAKSVWSAWSDHHPTIRKWLSESWAS